MKFPPPPGTGDTGAAAAPLPIAAKKKKKLLLLGGAVIGALAIGAGAFFYLTRPGPPPSKPAAKKPAAQPATPPGPVVATAQQVVEQAKHEQLAPLNEVVNADQAAKPAALPEPGAARPAETAAVTTATAPEAPVKPAGPPPPNAQFKAWVENLKIMGVRSGATPRVFIERTAYAPGDVVNPQLGIVFKGYDAGTRALIFADKSGAIVERRN